MKNPTEMSVVELVEMVRIMDDLEKTVMDNCRLSNLLMGRDYTAIAILRSDLTTSLKKLYKKVQDDNYTFKEEDVLELIYCVTLHEIINEFGDERSPDEVLEYVRKLKEELRGELMRKMHESIDEFIKGLVK